MDWEKKFAEGRELTGRRLYRDALTHYNELLEPAKEEDPAIFYSLLKAMADLLGYKGVKDHFNAIELYQKIINEYEEAPDELFDWCQAEIAATYLYLGMEHLDNFDTLHEIVNLENPDIEAYFGKLMEKREHFILGKAEAIYKRRM